MKRASVLIWALIMVFALTACGDMPQMSSEAVDAAETVTTQTTSEINSGGGSDTDQDTPATAVSYVTSEVVITKANADLPANPNRAWQENPASLCFPVKGVMNDEAEKMRTGILENTEQSVAITGTTYYVSERGSDGNDGTSKNSAWATLEGVQAHNALLKAGDAVLFERGGVFRGNMRLVSGVYYGAYGIGDKPCIYGSLKNYADSKLVNVGGNVWRFDERFNSDVGLLVFNHGEAVGNKCSERSELKQNYDFYCDSGNQNRVYLYFDENPADVFISIEIGANSRIFDFDELNNITIENLTFKYTGGHALRGSNTENITIRYCEIGYIGGSLLGGYMDGTVRYGNGIELMNGSRNTLVEHCWIYQIYDSGITHQGDTGVVENFTARNNLIEYCGMGAIEYWHTKNASMKNVLYTENLLRFSGYGFGGYQRPDKEMSAEIQSNGKATGVTYNAAENFVISDNIFELSTYQLVNATSAAGTPPVLSGNTYIQISGKWLGYYGTNTNIRFNASSEAIIKNTWGDSKAYLVFK